MSLKGIVLHVAKHTGALRLSRSVGPAGLPILCYHGYAFHDEHLFKPGLFHSMPVFEQRMEWLAREGFVTLPLDVALQKLELGTLQRNEIVLTIDDGFYSTLALAAPVMAARRFTATMYMTTYYMRHAQSPIFRLAIQYAFWRTAKTEAHFGHLVPRLDVPLATKGEKANVDVEKLIEFGETKLDEPARVELSRRVFEVLGCDYDELAASRRLSLMSPDEVARLEAMGFDIQLHTHRHRCGPDEARQEIIENREALSHITRRPLRHLCYPSGIWSRDVWPALEAEGVLTATTCEAGLNGRATPAYALHRILDSDTLPQITFEAEMSRLLEGARRLIGRRPSMSSHP